MITNKKEDTSRKSITAVVEDDRKPVYLVRCNFTSTKSKQYVSEVFEKNLAAICIEDDEKKDKQLYDDILNGRDVEYNRKKKYIHSFFDIVRQVKTNDILVVSSYLGKHENKIGLIKKGSEIKNFEKDGLILHCLQMEGEIKTLNLFDYPVLRSLIPQHVTISPIKNKNNRNKIYSLYYGNSIEFKIGSMSNQNIEIMCTEWLRSQWAPPEFKLQFQILRTGGNFPDVDILGYNRNFERIACQVTNTDDKNLIEKKAQKLKNFPADKKIMFSLEETSWESQYSLKKNIIEVWNNFSEAPLYRKFLEKLIRN